MFDKMFEKIAERNLTKPIGKLNNYLSWRELEKSGAIVKMTEKGALFDPVKLHAHQLKKSAFMVGVVGPAAAVIGCVLGNMKTKN